MRPLLALALLLLVPFGTGVEYRPLVLGTDGKQRQFPNGTDTLRTVPSYGLDASKPTASADNTGQIYIATDTTRIYRSTGAAWTIVGFGGTAGGDLTGTYPNPVVVQSSNVGGFGITAGDLTFTGDRTIKTATNGNYLNILGGTSGAADPLIQMFGSTYPSLGGRLYMDASRLILRGIGGAATGTVEVTGTTASTSPSTGALVVAGGVGITGANTVGGTLLTVGGAMRSEASSVSPGATGSGVELGYSAGSSAGFLQAYNRTSSAFTNLNLEASSLRLNPSTGGDVLVGTTTDAGSYRLQVNGGTLSTLFYPRPAGGSVSSAWEIGSDSTSDGLYFYDLTAAAYRMVINDAGETLLGTTADAGSYRLQVSGDTYQTGTSWNLGGTNASVATPAIRLNNDRIITWLDSSGLATNAGFLWYDSANDLNIGTNNNTRVTISDASLSTNVPILAPAATTSIPSIRLPHGTAPSSPTNGDMWTTTAGAYIRINGSTVGPLGTGGGGGGLAYVATANKNNSGASSTSEVSIIPTTGSGSLTIDGIANGSVIRVRWAGTYRSNGMPNVTFRVKLDGTTVASTPAAVSYDTSSSDDAFTGEVLITARTNGAQLDMYGFGFMEFHQSPGAFQTSQSMAMSNTTFGTIDPGSRPLDFTVQFGTSDANNYISISQFTVEHLTP